MNWNCLGSLLLFLYLKNLLYFWRCFSYILEEKNFRHEKGEAKMNITDFIKFKQRLTIKAYIISAVIIIAVILIAARFVHGGVAYKSVSLICYGFLIGYLVAWLHASLYYKKK
jgi:hypothetical protein